MTTAELRSWVKRTSRLHFAPAALDEVVRLIEAASPEMLAEVGKANYDADTAAAVVDRLGDELRAAEGTITALVARAEAAEEKARQGATAQAKLEALQADLASRRRWRG